uniref:Uncharacterized protein n=1 Tax=Euplotes crassus TaxID=5936 RepID=A0A7S3KCW9_EUPCR|mmetsp:Transcript_17781/g.17482  ORF Transcript_17781/g.17482 Transcript_17781/m.17482 type:complete len:215 (+) Transcript_17781:80-724(+)
MNSSDIKCWIKVNSLDETASQVMALQRERIHNLEQEYESLYGKYEDLINNKSVTVESTIEELLKRDMAGLKDKFDQEGYEDLIKQHAKEVSMLKAQVTEQGAKILLNKEDGSYTGSRDLPSMHKSGALKKTTTTHRLNPLRGPKSSYSNHEPLDKAGMSSLTPHKTSTIKGSYGDKMVSLHSYTDAKATYPYKPKPAYGGSVLNREYNSDFTKY